MDVSQLLDSLNDKQRQAVAANAGHYLVLAGAGSGKTRVLVHRIAWLIEVEQHSPYSILAVTFTNKAAGEMRARLESMLGFSLHGMWVGTFHSLAHRLLRHHWQDANLPQHFQILDADDQHRMVKRVMKALELDDSKWNAKQIQWFINAKKDEGLRPKHIDSYGDMHMKTMVKVYQAYEDACQRGGVIDFAEILLRAHELLLAKPAILKHYQDRFHNILVDEFQDTNTVQYAWVKLLAGQHAHVMIVGDDDQSIYGWRGAKIENIHRFAKDFPHTTTIRLEQNYRSTGTILKASNALINHNDSRMGKELWTSGHEGEQIALYAAFNEMDEARFVKDGIESRSEEGYKKQDIAILYRSNAQSRVIEEALLRAGIAYRVYGGLRFFERAEIKDVMGYLRLLASRDDDAAFERIINLPTRGIGERTLSIIRAKARECVCSLWQASLSIIKDQGLSPRALKALEAFISLVDDLDAQTEGDELYQQTEAVIHGSGLWQHYQKSKGEKAQSKLENIEELVNAAKQFQLEQQEEDTLPVLSAFLSHAALEAGEGQQAMNDDCVQLMTLHSAKGLEFPCVYMVGMEEGLFPHQMSIEEPGRLEEERRLCYVGMTRAMQSLSLSYAEVRRLHGREQYHRPSRFLGELPAECLTEVRSKNTFNRSTPIEEKVFQSSEIAETQFNVGDKVFHNKFGEGTITNYEGSGKSARVEVKFKRHGKKWLVLAYAKLQGIDECST